MPRFRTIVLGAVVVLATGGLGAGLAWRWVLREAIARKEGRAPSWSDLSRCGDWMAIGVGFAFLPITWGGVITFLSPLVTASGNFPEPGRSAIGVGGAIAVLGGTLALLYRFTSAAAIGDGIEFVRNRRSWVAGWVTHLAVSVAAGLPGVASWLAIDSAPMPTMILPLTILAFLAPGIGALAALPVMVRRFEMRAAPSEITGRPESMVVPLVAAFALLLLCAATAHNVFRKPVSAPVLAYRDFDSSVCGQPASWQDLEASRTREAVVAAGGQCSDRGAAGQAEIDGARLAWCTRWDVNSVQHLSVARLGPGERRVWDFDVASRSVVPTAAGLAFIATSRPAGHGSLVPGGFGPRVVLLGGDLAERASWQLPLESGAPLGYVLAPDPREGFLVGRRRGGQLRLVYLGPDLVPAVDAPAIYPPSYFHSMSYSAGSKTCLRFHTYGMGQGVVVLDGGARPWIPGPWHRAVARAGIGLYALGGVALFIAFLIARVVRAGRLARAMVRARPGHGVWVGRAETHGEVALLRTEAGVTLRLDLARTKLVGFDPGVALDGGASCVVLGTRAAGSGGAYRSDLDEIRSAVAVRGSPREAWDRAKTIQKVAFRRAVSAGWIVSVIPLVVGLFC